MSVLARYKKAGGMLELVKLIEESGEPKRTQLLKMIRTEDPQFAAQVEGKLFAYEQLRTLPENTLAEIIGNTPAKFVALAIHGESPEFTTLVEKCLGKSFNDYKVERENFVSAPPAAGPIETARRKLVATARKLESEGKIKLPGSDLGGGPGGTAASAAKLPSAESGISGNASLESGCPSTKTFGVEPPPPGLTGERFEQFLKNELGI